MGSSSAKALLMMGMAEVQAAQAAGALRDSADGTPQPPMDKGRDALVQASSESFLPASQPQHSRTSSSCAFAAASVASPRRSGYALPFPT